MNIRHLHRRIDLLTAEAIALVETDATLQRAFDQLTSVRGIATHNAVQLLPELLVLPRDMTARCSAIRNMVRAGLPQSVAMRILGHVTTSVFLRYDIPSEEEDKREALRRTATYVEALPSRRTVEPIRAFAGENRDSYRRSSRTVGFSREGR